jgi:hypothetical protein
MTSYTHDKLAGYAAALDDDIGSERSDLVIDGKLDRGHGGTVYGAFVMTEKGHRFGTKYEARENAKLFVQQCKDALIARKIYE